MKDKIIAKALKDADFRKRLVKDPSAAVEKDFGVKLPAGLKVKVVEDSAETVHLVLPPAAGQALSDAELGGVAGGAKVCIPGGRLADTREIPASAFYRDDKPC